MNILLSPRRDLPSSQTNYFHLPLSGAFPAYTFITNCFRHQIQHIHSSLHRAIIPKALKYLLPASYKFSFSLDVAMT